MFPTGGEALANALTASSLPRPDFPRVHHRRFRQVFAIFSSKTDVCTAHASVAAVIYPRYIRENLSH